MFYENSKVVRIFSVSPKTVTKTGWGGCGLGIDQKIYTNCKILRKQTPVSGETLVLYRVLARPGCLE